MPAVAVEDLGAVSDRRRAAALLRQLDWWHLPERSTKCLDAAGL